MYLAFDLLIRLPAAAITGYLAIQTLIFMYYGQKRRLDAYFLAMCIIATTSLVVASRFGSTASLPDLAKLLQWQFACILAFMPVLYGFIADYVKQARHQIWQWLYTTIAAGLILVNFTITPYSLRFSTLKLLPNYMTPWGGMTHWFVGTHSIWYFVSYGLFAVLVIWAIVRVTMFYHVRRHRSALVLIGALAFLLATLIYSLLPALGFIDLVIPGGLGIFGLLVFMSTSMAMDMRENYLALKATARDLQEEIKLRQQAEERIRHMAYHDYLTNLPNRIKLHELLPQAMCQSRETGRKGALILLDLNEFKAINDKLGNSFGNRLLQLIGKKLQQLVEDGGTLTHLGGDEFVILLPDVGPDSNEGAIVAQRIADRNIEALSLPFSLEGHSIELSACAGIALFPEDDENETGLLQRVEMARDHAHSFGRKSIQLYASEMRAEMHERLQLERDMRKGIEREEFRVYFQPQVDLGGNVVGAEALLRWQHPERGFISPAVFIPIAERSGLIFRLGEWTLQQVCRHITTWKQSLPFFSGHLAVNVSAWHFMQSNFKEDVRRCLSEAGIEGERINIEITESAFIGDIDDAVATINFLHSHGMRVSIDDFGTGYSSLSYLRRLPVDELKIDQAFIRNLGANLRDTHLVETIIDIGKFMDTQIVAEGVETEFQKTLLAKMGCWALQGYCVARPMDQEAFSDWLTSRYKGMAV